MEKMTQTTFTGLTEPLPQEFVDKMLADYTELHKNDCHRCGGTGIGMSRGAYGTVVGQCGWCNGSGKETP
jgi:hypothetical protein